ncbi:3-oxoacyl-ACP synthase [Flavobacteriaceae bacterium F89]|uniref:3-oxoacyl-ACP synthase n=1 Tax=Cerina litoralis TaxID=2874477 RepID=A0AAE3ERY4_9FLAO|nr:3-oxoacyl-ACP synthase [Cerina litoralis]MCG2459303.1 3-oxoacyl-ACP synthase [Cerina litoralis]
MTIKQVLYDFCQFSIQNRIDNIQENIRSLQESLTSETKSSAGDKHETGRAMIQLEREKLGNQLQVAERTKQVLDKLVFKVRPVKIVTGTLVYTTKANYFLSVSLGEFRKNEFRAYCISPQTPMGVLLLGRSSGEVIDFNGESIKILKLE